MQKTQEVLADEYLTAAEAMDALNISRRTLDRYVEDGRLEASKLPTGHRRFRRVDVAALLTPADVAQPASAQV